MPSTKKRITLYCTDKLQAKAEYLAKEEGRSLSNYTQRLLEKEIKKYELENGEIKF